MKISTGLICCIVIWIFAQTISGVPYTESQTNFFLFSSGIFFYCWNKIRTKNREKLQHLSDMNWGTNARLRIEEVAEVPALPPWLAQQMPFERKMVTVGSLRVHYIDDGPKDDPTVPTILFLHGDPGWCYTWRDVILNLKKQQICRCIAPDLIGYGLSEKADFMEHIGIRAENQMRIISCLVDYLKLKNLIVVGLGWGGLIASGVCRRQGDKLYGCVLMNTQIRNPRENPRILKIARLSNYPYIGAFFFRWLNITSVFMHLAWGRRRPFDPKIRKAYIWGTGGLSPLKWSSRCASLSFARAMPAPVGHLPIFFHSGLMLLKDAEEWACRFGMPCELLWGAADPYLGRSMKRVEDAFVAPGARTFQTSLPDVGHFVPEEAPEEVAAAVLRNIRRMKEYVPSLVGKPDDDDYIPSVPSSLLKDD